MCHWILLSVYHQKMNSDWDREDFLGPILLYLCAIDLLNVEPILMHLLHVVDTNILQQNSNILLQTLLRVSMRKCLEYVNG